jgi:hypothetical protein
MNNDLKKKPEKLVKYTKGVPIFLETIEIALEVEV